VVSDSATHGAATRLVIVMWSAAPDREGGAVLAAAPFVYAIAARALDIDVEMHFTSSAVRWLLPGVATQAFTDQAHTRTVAQYINESKDAGVKMYACAMARAEHAPGEHLIAACDGIAGAATVVGTAMRPDTRTIVF
jgi:predicted peroxiredoxin